MVIELTRGGDRQVLGTIGLASEDRLLPWGDPYVLSLFAHDDEQEEARSEFGVPLHVKSDITQNDRRGMWK